MDPFRFDFYGATVQHQFEAVIPPVIEALKLDEVRRLERGLYGYPEGIEFVKGGQRQAFAFYDRARPSKGVHFQASGLAAANFADVLRFIHPSHKVSRADVCSDRLGGRKAFIGLRRAGVKLAKEKSLNCREIRDPADSGGGRTLYLGSPASVVSARIYEKGLHPDAAAQGIPSDVVRLEFQCRPQSRAKDKAATVSPDDFAAGSAWSMALTEAAGLIPGERFQLGTVWSPPQLEKTIGWMVRQYGGALAEFAEKVGGWHKVGPELAQQIEKARQARQ